MGADQGCCGKSDQGGCGKCVLVTMDHKPDFKAVAMKKNRCPPESNGCDRVHFDLAIPGFDNLQYSLANICGERPGTGFSNREASAVMTIPCNAGDCGKLPEQFQKGCKLFCEWGWPTGNPNGKVEIVECPPNFVKHVQAQFGPSGVIEGAASVTPAAGAAPAAPADGADPAAPSGDACSAPAAPAGGAGVSNVGGMCKLPSGESDQGAWCHEQKENCCGKCNELGDKSWGTEKCE